MAPLHALAVRIKSPGRYLVSVAALLVLLWGWATPPGLLGKADAIGYAVCHRIDLRSFHIGTRPLPLCARCTGQYLGAMLGLAFQAVYSRRRAGFPPRRLLAILGIFGLAYAVDGINSYFYLPPFLQLFPSMPHLYAPTNTLRLLTGTGVGLALAAILYPALVATLYRSPNPSPALPRLEPLLALVGLALLVDGLVLTGWPYALFPAALVSALGVVILLGFAYTIVVLRILKQENTYSSLRQAILPFVAGFTIAMAQVAVFDLLRYLLTGTWNGFRF